MMQASYKDFWLWKGTSKQYGFTMFDSVTMYMGLAGIFVWILFWVSVQLGPANIDWAAISMIIAIGWVYRQSKKAAEELRSVETA